MRRFASIAIMAEIIAFVLIVLLLLLLFSPYFSFLKTRICSKKYCTKQKNDVELDEMKLILVVSVSVIN